MFFVLCDSVMTMLVLFRKTLGFRYFGRLIYKSTLSGEQENENTEGEWFVQCSSYQGIASQLPIHSLLGSGMLSASLLCSWRFVSRGRRMNTEGGRGAPFQQAPPVGQLLQAPCSTGAASSVRLATRTQQLPMGTSIQHLLWGLYNDFRGEVPCAWLNPAKFSKGKFAVSPSHSSQLASLCLPYPQEGCCSLHTSPNRHSLLAGLCSGQLWTSLGPEQSRDRLCPVAFPNKAWVLALGRGCRFQVCSLRGNIPHQSSVVVSNFLNFNFPCSNYYMVFALQLDTDC